MGLTKGADAIEQQEKAAAEARKAAFSADRLEYLSIADGDTAYIRLMTPADEWLFVAQHSFVKTKPQPADYKGNKWPGAMGAVCRNDVGVRDELKLPPNDCYVCTNKLPSGFRKDQFAKASNRVWAVAALRHQIRGDGTPDKGGEEFRGKLIGYDDVMEEYKLLDKDGKPTEQTGERIKLVLINMTYKQIFATLKHADMNYTGGVQGRDFAIRRTGSGTDTEYQVLALDPIEEDANGTILKPGSPGWKRYEQVMQDREVDLVKIVLKQASDEHYARWFDVTKTVKDGKVVPVEGATISETSAEVYKGEYPPADDDSPMSDDQRSKLADLRSRLTSK